jgi:hypothetical protein
MHALLKNERKCKFMQIRAVIFSSLMHCIDIGHDVVNLKNKLETMLSTWDESTG